MDQLSNADLRPQPKHKDLLKVKITISISNLVFRRGLPVLTGSDGTFNKVLMLGTDNADNLMLKK